MTGNGTFVLDIKNSAGDITGYIAGFGGSGDVWVSVSDPDAQVNALKEFLTTHVQTCRQYVESLGVNVNGNIFSTDVASQVKYVGILVYASMDKTYLGTWKTENNGFVTLDSTSVVVMCMFVMAYIQVCFAWEQYILAQINASVTIEQLQAIDLVFGRPDGNLPPEVIVGIQSSVGALADTSLSGTSLSVSGTARVHKLKGATSIPTIACGPGAGSAAMVGLTSGSTDLAGQISVVASGTMSEDAGVVIAEIVFSEPYTTTPFVTFCAANIAAGSVTCAPYVHTSLTGFSLRVGNNSGLAEGTHLFNYTVIQ